MKTLGTILALVTLAGTAAAQPRPVIIEESAVLTTPDATIYPDFGFEAAMSGNDAIIAGYRLEYADGTEIRHYYALAYRRVNGQWTFDRVLRYTPHEYDSYVYPVEFAIEGDLAAVNMVSGTDLYRRVGGNWVAERIGGEPAEDLHIQGGRILAAQGGWDGRVVERTAAGTLQSFYLMGQPRGSDDEFWGGPVAIRGNYVVLGTPYTDDLEPQEVPVYQRTADTWSLWTKIQVPYGDSGLGAAVTIHNDNVIVDSLGGAYRWALPYINDPNGRVRAVDAALASGQVFVSSNDYVLIRETSPDLGKPVIKVFRQVSGTSPNRDYEHVATLVAKNGGTLGGSVSISGNSVMVGSGEDRVYVFQLPATFAPSAPRYDDFQSGAGAAWTQSAGAQFAVATSGTNRVFRQSSVVGDAQAVLASASWRDQAIEAEVRATAFDGNDRWTGLATRFANAQNYYYVTLRGSNTVQLRRMRNGAFTVLASAPLTVSLNRMYRLRLESIGTAHRVYVDGVRVLEAFDADTGAAGGAALLTYRARADFDNVSVTPSSRATVYASAFTPSPGTPPRSQPIDSFWKTSGVGQWTLPGNGTLQQGSVTGDARAFVGTPTDDQSVELRVRPIAYAVASGTQERWVGVMARYVNERNYYYLSLRSSNALSLRKLTNGVITTLATVPFNVSLGAWHTLKLETAGGALRGYVNGALALQATDTTHPTGSSGAITYRAAAEFDDYVAYQH